MNWKALATPQNLLIAAVIATLIVLVLIIVVLIKRYTFTKRLIGLKDNPGPMDKEQADYFSKSRLLHRSSLVEKIGIKQGVEILETCRINQYWLEELKLHKRKSLYDRILNYYPDKGLFTCFLIALERKEFALRLIQWLDNSGEFLVMRRIALSGVGEEFSGKKALDIFKDNLPQIREMTGDPEWASRYFAIKILLYDDQNEQSIRAIWESFSDPHSLIRRTIAMEFNGDNREKLYNELYRLFLCDPVQEVRSAAKDRISRDFTDIYNINIDSLNPWEALHALEHLSAFSKADEDTAIRFLDNDNLELRFSAARFLEERGALKRLLLNADMGDRKDLARIENLLTKSCEVHISAFLETAAKSSNPGTLLMGVNILAETGDVSLIQPICSRILSLPQDSVENKLLFDKALVCIKKRGTEKSLLFLKDMLIKNKYNREYAEKILDSLPPQSAPLLIGTLLDLFCDSKFVARDELRSALVRFPSYMYIQKILSIIKSGRGQYAHIMRIDALKILVELKQSFCLQTILENLPILPLEEARKVAILLVEYNQKDFFQLTKHLLESNDSALRASLISCMPAVDGQVFLKFIKEALNDADPEVRISAIWALVDFKEKKTISQAISMLRDPVERVRTEVARSIAEIGSESALEELKTILNDNNEVQSVKLPAIKGLSASSSLLSIDILCDLLVHSDDYDKEAISALSAKTLKNEMSYMVEKFKDGTPGLRDKLTTVFSKMKETGETVLVDLLKEDITALKPFICQVLENTGYIESQIRFLKHRDPAIRRKAASELSYIGTESAFRGIVLAARDSDEEVRIAVTKALEKLNKPDGNSILKSLQEDPDKKVRKYTSWALNRLSSINMES